MLMRVGLTGNIGSGKSAVAELFQLVGIPVINLDAIGKALKFDKKTTIRIKELLGSQSVSQKMLNRPIVREVVFKSSSKRKKLEQILHPLIFQEYERTASLLEVAGKPLIICEAALIFESQLNKILDKIIVVAASEGLRFERLRVRDEMSSREFNRISNSQMSQSKKLKKADYIIDNSGTLEELKPQVNSLINRWHNEGII